MRGYAAKVGLRKPGTLAWAQAQLNDPHLTTDEWDEFIEYQSSHLTPAQVDAFAPWFADMRRPLKIHDPEVHQPFDDEGVDYCGWRGDGGIYGGCGEVWPCTAVLPPADPHWTDEDRIALGVECLLCHNAAAGHDRTVPPDHDCGDWERVIDCAECDDLTPTEQEADRNAAMARVHASAMRTVERVEEVRRTGCYPHPTRALLELLVAREGLCDHDWRLRVNRFTRYEICRNCGRKRPPEPATHNPETER